MKAPHPFLSVIVPAHQGVGVLPRSLDALLASDLPRESWELIVVDDASTDETSLIAARYADTVVQLAGRPHGPAYARNRGFEASRGEVIVFVDADVCVHRDTLRRFATLFASDPTVAAAFGSYDTRPAAPGIVSQYRNLMHAYVHQRNPGEAETFWAGCGAIRRDAFEEVGRFDEWHYARPQIEDIELGRRLRRHGHRILLRPEIQCTHLKRWTLRDVIRTDFRHRGVPWMWLILQEGPEASRTLNIRAVEKWCTFLVGLALLLFAAALLGRSAWPALGAAVALSLVLLLNHGLYAFFVRHRGPAFAVAVVPLHLLYYVNNGVSAVWGSLMRTLFGEPPAPVEAAAQADMGIRTWPPGPTRPTASVWDEPEESEAP